MNTSYDMLILNLLIMNLQVLDLHNLEGPLITSEAIATVKKRVTDILGKLSDDKQSQKGNYLMLTLPF